MNIPKIILSRPKLVVDTRCPKCNSLDILALPTVEVTCKNYKTKFTTNTQINIYFSIAKKLLQLISHNNEVVIVGERDYSEVYNAEDMLKPRSRKEDEVYQTLLAIEHNFKDQKCYDVSKITSTYDEEYRIRCNNCGVCQNCVTCTRCGHKYVPKTISTYKRTEKKYICPKCGNKRYDKTYITDLKNNCPYCKSNNIKRTLFSSNRKHCPKCKSNNISKPRNIPVYKLVIKRQRRFEVIED